GPLRAVEKREFGFGVAGKLRIRHKAFPSLSTLTDFVRSLLPSDAYHSAAFYARPDAEIMKGKDWQAAELIFDIDCDHIPTPCKKTHDKWQCLNCSNEGPGKAPEKCVRCGKSKFKEEGWVCSDCLGAAKKEALKLISILKEDLNIAPSEMNVVFSGHRGYHIHMDNEEINKLDAVERKEIVDYVTASGINLTFHGSIPKKHQTWGPSGDMPGWSGRLAKVFYSLLHMSEEEWRNRDIPDIIQRRLSEKRAELLKAGPSEDMWRILGRMPEVTFRKTMEKIPPWVAAAIDTVVTTDIHRLIRLPNTLHGKTALRVAPVNIDRLESFDPFTEAVAFTMEETVKVTTRNSPTVVFNGRVYGPFAEGEVYNLPLAVSIFLLCRGRAILTNG
ncbi:MAG: DNA primase small subunit domain-containing protein, partial [Candidatus Bathyarchaeia archaeon]